MNEQDKTDYYRIEEAIGYISANFKAQPGLDEVAAMVHLSPFHFQRLFSDWAGVSPKKFLQYISIGHAKKLLARQATLTDTAFETGLSGTGRLHDLFVTIEGMTPGEYKNGGEHLLINYSYTESPFGKIIIASTSKGVCHVSFLQEEQEGLTALQNSFPNAAYRHITDSLQEHALGQLRQDWSRPGRIKLHIKGTGFQLKVWELLLKIPTGGLATYGTIARLMQQPGASRAVGSAIGDNPVAFLIPCHRVIQSSGALGQYHWGSNRKAAIIGWEAAQTDTDRRD